MIDATQIRTLAAQAQIDPGILEKDYVLSKTLMALAQITEFQKTLVFKGGTALKKCYYPDWRFSEDLDFTALKPLRAPEIKAVFQQSVKNAAYQSGLPLEIIEYSQYPKTSAPPIAAQLKIGYDGPLRKASGQKNNIRVDIAFSEVVTQSVTKSIFMLYEDDADVQLSVYSLEEIISEKLRSILQRGKSRDYYDVWVLLKEKQHEFSFNQVRELLAVKCHHKQIPIPKVHDFLAPKRIEEAAKYWERGLAHQTANLPPFSKVVDELKSLLPTT